MKWEIPTAWKQRLATSALPQKDSCCWGNLSESRWIRVELVRNLLQVHRHARPHSAGPLSSKKERKKEKRLGTSGKEHVLSLEPDSLWLPSADSDRHCTVSFFRPRCRFVLRECGIYLHIGNNQAVGIFYIYRTLAPLTELTLLPLSRNKPSSTCLFSVSTLWF